MACNGADQSVPPLLTGYPPPHTHILKGVDTPAGAHPPGTDSRMDMNITHIVGDKVGRSFTLT